MVLTKPGVLRAAEGTIRAFVVRAEFRERGGVGRNLGAEEAVEVHQRIGHKQRKERKRGERVQAGKMVSSAVMYWLIQKIRDETQGLSALPSVSCAARRNHR